MQAMAETKSEVTEMSDRVEGLELGNLYGGRCRRTPARPPRGRGIKARFVQCLWFQVCSGFDLRALATAAGARGMMQNSDSRNLIVSAASLISPTRSESRPRPRAHRHRD